MSKIMPLELLSSIKGAQSSGAVEKLFEVIKKAIPERDGKDADVEPGTEAVSFETLRSDVVQESSAAEKKLIRENFPAGKNGYLVVPKVIED